ncbi:MAG: aconitate hydratase [Desulfococcaceae bacterium]
MAKNVTQKLVAAHLLEGEMTPGAEIGLKIDQTLTQDATGTMVMLEFEAMNLPRVRTELSAQYVDHNLLQLDFKNADDHLFLRSACKKFGVWYSRPGNGVSHPVHMEHFGVPGKTLLGSDSHTPSAGALGMLAIGAGGLDVAMAMAGEPFYATMPEIWGVKLTGRLPDWCSAKDVILEMLRRHGVDGGFGRVIEYRGPGLDALTAMDRHVIANMGAELGATSTVFPADEAARKFLKANGREEDYAEILADPDCDYDVTEEIDLSEIEPLIAKPSSPGNVAPVREVAGREICQSYIGSSANPGMRDIAIAALIVKGKQVHDRVSFDINPTSRQIVENLIDLGLLKKLIRAGARVHQPGCNGCIGMGQAPASETISLRTVPRNFPGRSGTKGDQVYLCSPETAAASALTGVITDPRTLDMDYPKFAEPETLKVNWDMLVAPAEEGESAELRKGPNIRPLPDFAPLPETIEGPVLLKMGDDVSTDEIMPAGSAILPFRSNIPEIGKFTFSRIDEDYYDKAQECRDSGSLVIAGDNYGQGSSREHAVLGPRSLGLQAVIAKSIARIHWQNLVNFGILPLQFADPADYEAIQAEDVLRIPDVREAIRNGETVTVENKTQGTTFEARHRMTALQVEMVLEGAKINVVRKRKGGQ